MPHFNLFRGYYWKLSSDDFWFPTAVSTCYRSFLSVFVAASLHQLYNCRECCSSLDKWKVAVCYLSFSLLILICQITCEYFIIRDSTQGTLTDSQKRDYDIHKSVLAFIALKFVVVIAISLGIVVIIEQYLSLPCRLDSSSNAITLWPSVMTTFISQVVDVFSSFCCFLFLQR
jgi:hypothetical protein